MSDDKLDLTSLYPTMTENRWDRIVEEIMVRARPELVRRAARGGLLGTLGEWMWPALTAAALAAIISGTVLSQVGRTADGASVAGGLLPALDVAEPVSAWLDEERGPLVSDLILAMEGDGR